MIVTIECLEAGGVLVGGDALLSSLSCRMRLILSTAEGGRVCGRSLHAMTSRRPHGVLFIGKTPNRTTVVLASCSFGKAFSDMSFVYRLTVRAIAI